MVTGVSRLAAETRPKVMARQLTFDELSPPASPKEFNPEKKICHGVTMRKIELSLGKFGYRCDECQTLMVKSGKD